MNRLLLAAALAVLAIGIGQASAQTVVFATLNETFESYPADAQLPAPWIGGDLAYSVAAGYSTNATLVAKVTERVSVPGVELQDLVGLNHGLLYLDFDMADNGTSHCEKFYFRNYITETSYQAVREMYVAPAGAGVEFNVEFSATKIIDFMTPGQWYHVKLTMDLDNNTLAAAVDGVPKFSGYPIGDYALQRIGFTAYKAVDFGSGTTYWDNFKVQMQCYALVEPRNPQTFDLTAIPAPPAPYQVAYTVTNVGLDALTYTVEEADATGQPHDYPWLSLDKTSGSLASGQVNTVTAKISPCGSSDRTAYVKFSNSCVPFELRQIDLVVPWPAGCNCPLADADGDGDVDQADFAVLQLCYTGPDGTSLPPGLPQYCACLDHADDDNDPLTPPGSDGNIDSFDVIAFENCATGPGVAWMSTPDCP